MQGTVKFFNEERGFGFIQPDDGGRDVFVHIRAVERAGAQVLNEGQKVSFDLVVAAREPVISAVMCGGDNRSAAAHRSIVRQRVAASTSMRVWDRCGGHRRQKAHRDGVATARSL
jgi:cold shock protein